MCVCVLILDVAICLCSYLPDDDTALSHLPSTDAHKPIFVACQGISKLVKVATVAVQHASTSKSGAAVGRSEQGAAARDSSDEDDDDDSDDEMDPTIEDLVLNVAAVTANACADMGELMWVVCGDG